MSGQVGVLLALPFANSTKPSKVEIPPSFTLCP